MILWRKRIIIGRGHKRGFWVLSMLYYFIWYLHGYVHFNNSSSWILVVYVYVCFTSVKKLNKTQYTNSDLKF